ncbi:uncharacterized protein LOC119634624 [Glossina fuscipes]|uniref:Uncharacterized protein LOC119634624 n=1 Tax=Glossina fuscipes TaxID=7396 RepID=A0A8U0WHZ1_9MUSC|nr:uncharacterized protein LOC119634624 [Glossina fuscipes]KAI9584864.1 hypothetical protein GQX74_006759 [Glossina fuscipes]
MIDGQPIAITIIVQLEFVIYFTIKGNLACFKEEEDMFKRYIQIAIKLVCVCLMLRNNLEIPGTFSLNTYSSNIPSEIKIYDNRREIPHRSARNSQSNKTEHIIKHTRQTYEQGKQHTTKTTTNANHNKLWLSSTESIQRESLRRAPKELNFAYVLEQRGKGQNCCVYEHLHNASMNGKSSLSGVKKVDNNSHDVNINNLRLTETVLALHHALDKISKFCAFLKQLIVQKTHSRFNESGSINDVYIDNKLIPSDTFISDDKQGKQLKDAHAASLKEDSRHSYKNSKTSSPISTLSILATDAGHRLEARKLRKVKKKYRKFLFPLLLAYKLKFFTLIPVLISGLILLVASTGLAGFFFALFTAVMSLKGTGGKAVVVQEY